MPNSDLITPQHLARKALIYIRQSTPARDPGPGTGSAAIELQQGDFCAIAKSLFQSSWQAAYGNSSPPTQRGLDPRAPLSGKAGTIGTASRTCCATSPTQQSRSGPRP